ncbi:MAG: hypothetical protein GXO29_01410 [Thermotogae bacterium]|nr:hypothetical protein [Thermotogota bacterium]
MIFLLTSSPTIEAISVEGNRWTRSDYILRYAGIRRGDTVSDSLLETVERRLWQLGLFRAVDVALVGDTLKIKVEEMWYIYPVPYLSISSQELSYGVGIYHGNFRGMGEKIYGMLTWGDRRMLVGGWSTASHRMALNVFSLDGGKEVYNSQLYLMPLERLFLKATYTARLEPPWRLKLEIEGDITTSDSTHLLYGDSKDSFLKAGFYLYRDTRDWEPYPRRGYVSRGHLISYVGDFAAWYYGGDFRAFLTLGRITLVPYVSLHAIFGDVPIYVQLPLIGRSDILRGSIPEDRWLGYRRGIVSAEVRYLVWERFPEPLGRFLDGGGAAVVFADAGWIDARGAALLGVGAYAYTPFGRFLGLVGYGTGGLNLFFGESRRIY